MSSVEFEKEQLTTLKKGQLEQIIQRLREEKNSDEAMYFAWGCREGFEAAQQAEYVELKQVLKWNVDEHLRPYTENEDNESFFKSLCCNDPNLTWENGVLSEELVLLLRGYQEGFREFWRIVKDKL